MSVKVVNPKTAIRRAGMSLIGVSILAGGCQQPQQAMPLRLSVMSDQVSVSDRGGKETPYINPDFRESDDASDGIVYTVVAQTGSVIGAIFSPVVTLTTHTISFLSDDRPSHAYQLLYDKNSADNRRDGMNKLADFGLLDSMRFREVLRDYADRDPDVSVRATAIRTCNRARDHKATPIFIKGLADPNEWVRLESAKALANVPDVKAAEALAKMLNSREESRDNRIAAADALKHYRTLTTARSLTSALDDKSFAIAWQSRRSLRYLTDKDFGYDGAAWLGYFTGPINPLR